MAGAPVFSRHSANGRVWAAHRGVIDVDQESISYARGASRRAGMHRHRHTGAVAQEKTVMVGGAAMYPSKDIIDNAVNSKDHTTLVAAVKAAGLVDTLKGAGPFTVFAPTNAAFAALPAGTVETLLKPENKAQLTKILTYHVVAAKVDAAALMGMINKDGGKHAIKTVAGDTLIASVQGGKVVLTDAKGGMSTVTQVDVIPEERRDPRRRQGAVAIRACGIPRGVRPESCSERTLPSVRLADSCSVVVTAGASDASRKLH